MTGLEAFKIVYNNFDYLISDVCIENDDVNICLKTIKEQLPTIKQALIKVEKEHKALEIIKPLCEVVETPVKKYRYLKVNGVVVYTFKNEEEFDLLKEVLE